MKYIQILGGLAGLLTSTSMLPQLIKVIKEKKSEGVSLTMMIVLLMGLATWIVYGGIKEDWPVFFTNIFAFIVNALLLFFWVKYKKNI